MDTGLIFRALEIYRSLGTRRAAGFLRNRGVPVEAAVRLLAVRPHKECRRKAA
jgi:hypothetical protein